MARRDPQPLPEGRAPVYTDLDAEGRQRAAYTHASNLQVHSRITEAMDSARRGVVNPESSEKQRKGHERRLGYLQKAEPLVTDLADPATFPESWDSPGAYEAGQAAINAGAANRISLFQDAVGRSLESRGSRIPDGALWYKGHGEEVATIHRAYPQIPLDQVINASATMSAQNSPENEKRALAAAATATVSNPEVTADGVTRRFNDIPAKEVGGMKSRKEREARQVESTADLAGMAVGGIGFVHGLEMLRGERHGDTHIGDMDTGKVPSYRDVIRDHVNANASEVSELGRRVHLAAGGRTGGSSLVGIDKSGDSYFEQPTLFGAQWERDPWGKAEQATGILNPGSGRQWREQGSQPAPTAGDTWMRGIDRAQPNHAAVINAQATGNDLVVGKLVGTDPTLTAMGVEDVHPTPVGSRKLTGQHLHNAISNEADVRAARYLSTQAEARGENMGAGLPAHVMQAVPWTEERVQVGLDEGTKSARKEASVAAQAAAEAEKAKSPKSKKPGQISFDSAFAQAEKKGKRKR